MEQSAIDWFNITKTGGNAAWLRFYAKMMGQAVSEPTRLFEAVERLGHEPVFQAIVLASTKKITGDGLNYVLAIAVRTVSDEVGAINEDSKYKMSIAKAKLRTEIQNEKLQQEIEKAKEFYNGSK